MSAVDMTEAGARAFLADIGIDGREADALLVGKVETDTDDGMQVPKAVKKRWQRWNMEAHPDKGGGHEVYNDMKKKYTDFKTLFEAWLQSYPTGEVAFKDWCKEKDEREARMNKTKRKAEAKKNAQKAMTAAQKALEEGKYCLLYTSPSPRDA